jgi:hypothetical protein
MPSPVTSPAWLNPSGGRRRSQEPQFSYINESGQYVQSIFTGERDPVTARWLHDLTPIPLGTLVVADWFGTRHGPGKIGDDTCLVAMHLEPSLIPPGDGFRFVVRIPMLVQGIDRVLPWYCNGDIAQREMGYLRDVFCRSAEAAAGQLFVYALRPSRPFTSSVKDQNTGTFISKRFTAPVWEHVDTMDRDPAIFGECLVPSTSMQIGAASAPPMLSRAPVTPGTDGDTPAATAPVTADPFARIGQNHRKDGGAPF